MKQLALTVLICSAATLFSAMPLCAATIALSPPSLPVMPGDVILLDIVVASLGAAHVGDFDLDIAFDPALLTLSAATPTAFLGDIASGEALDFSLGLTAPGTLNLAVVSTLSAAGLAAIQPAAFSLATLSFTVGTINFGASTSVGIARVNALGDAFGAAIPVDSLGAASLARSSTVPEPASVVLIGLGLIAMCFRWRISSYLQGRIGNDKS